MKLKTFAHVFKYKIIYMLNDPIGLFWLLAFPLILATFFYLGFGNIDNVKFEKINI